jgi:multidrug resistance efflux pump
MKKFITPFLLIFALLVLSACSTKTVQATSDTVSPVSSNLIAEGSLQPINSLAHSFSTSGEVAEVLVKNGDQVNTGQVLARLKDSTEAQLALANAKMNALAAQQTYDALINSNLPLAQAQLDAANAKQAYDKAVWNQNRKGQARETNPDVLNAARASVTLADKAVSDAQEKYDGYSETADSDPQKAAALSLLSKNKLALNQAKENLNYYLNPPDDKELAISEGEVAVARAKYDDALRKLEKLQSGSDSDELVFAQASLDSAKAALVNAQNMVDSLELKANIAGSVVDLNLQPGQKIAAGETAVTIADYSNWLVKTDNLTETEVTSITVGQKTQLVLDAIPQKTFDGKVTYINSLYEEKRGDVTYTVTILLTQTDPLMRWGMTGVVTFLP